MIRWGLSITILLFGFVAHAEEISIDSVWLRATAPGQDSAGVDMTITSKRAATLFGVSSPVAKAVELHAMTNEHGMMRMHEVRSIALPAGKRVNLRVSGYHLMLNGLVTPLKAGDHVPLTLSIKVANDPLLQVETRVEVQPLTAQQPVERQHAH